MPHHSTFLGDKLPLKNTLVSLNKKESILLIISSPHHSSLVRDRL